MEPRNRYGHSFVLAFSAPSVPQDFRFNEHTHIHPHTTGRERGEIDTKRKRVKRERDKVRERAMREHIYVYNERCRENERERDAHTRAQRETVRHGWSHAIHNILRAKLKCVPPTWATFRHGSCISVRVTDRDERERERRI